MTRHKMVRQHGKVGLDAFNRLYLHGKKTNFWVTEMVSRKTFMTHGYNSVYFVDGEILELLQFARNHFGKPIRVNDWWTGGHLQQRGFRSDLTSVGAKNSQHRYRRAVDWNINSMTADEVREEIMNNGQEFYDQGLRRLEHGDYAPTWIHMDIQDTGVANYIHIFKPIRDITTPQAELWSKTKHI